MANDSMLISHLNAVEQILIYQSSAAQNAGHPNIRGGPREWFIREFLENHLPSTLEIGQGEIIDVDSVPNPLKENYRPQVDIIIYRRDIPKIRYSRNYDAFFVEGVMATIESKSSLTKKHFELTCTASVKHKKLKRQPQPKIQIEFGWVPPHIVSYIVAFDGPANMSTIANWLKTYVEKTKVDPDHLVDMIVILGKGVLWKINAFPNLKFSNVKPGHRWAFIERKNQNLLTMFTHMLTWIGSTIFPPSMLGYASNALIGNFQLC